MKHRNVPRKNQTGQHREESGAGAPRTEVVRRADSEMLNVELNITHSTFSNKKPQPGLMPNWGFLVLLLLLPVTASE
jgi:hypothetical protein